MSKKMLVILSVIMLLSVLLSACKLPDNSNGNATSDAILNVLTSQSNAENAVADFLQGTCQKSDGVNCDLMGE